MQIAGTGNVVCHNRISGFGDAIDTFSAYPCAAIDFYGNEISECTDDGIEMDYSEHNTRCFENRLTNVFQGISVQPVHGGPVYVFRNAIYNVGLETFKMHNHPSGAIFYHNTSVKAGMPLILATNDAVSNCVSATTCSWARRPTTPTSRTPGCKRAISISTALADSGSCSSNGTGLDTPRWRMPQKVRPFTGMP